MGWRLAAPWGMCHLARREIARQARWMRPSIMLGARAVGVCQRAVRGGGRMAVGSNFERNSWRSVGSPMTWAFGEEPEC